MIETQDLTKWFDDFVAVDGVNLSVPAGQVLVLLGPNGAGKTTTVRMLTSILKPTRGCARVAGYDVVTQADKVRSAVGVLTEHHGLYGRMNAPEYLEFFGQLYGLENALIRRRTSELLDQFGLTAALKKRLGEYSKGMRQKLALVRALLPDPPVLLLDEPTSAMDPESARIVRDAIHLLKSKERTILLCTHNLVEAEELADQVAIIRRGHIIFNETLEQLADELLGPPEYEVRLAQPLDGREPSALDGVRITALGVDWLRCQVNDAQVDNPRLIRALLDQNFLVVSVHKAPRNLERAYLEAVSRYAEA